MTRLVLIDGSNMVMRAAFGGQVPTEEAARIATGMIRRAAVQAGASHIIVAVDSTAPSWRKREFPAYKANRQTDTSPWVQAGHRQWLREGWMVEECPGYEADDVIATIAKRAREACQVTVVSSDSDLLSLTASGAEILKPINGGGFHFVTKAEVCIKYDLPAAELLTDFKAMVGETGDNVPGVPGIGPARASKLLNTYGPLETIFAAGAESRCKDSARVNQHKATAETALKLVSLSFDAPILPIKPSDCIFRNR